MWFWPPFASTSCFLNRKEESLLEFWLKTEDMEGPAAVSRSGTLPRGLSLAWRFSPPCGDVPQSQGSGALLSWGGSFR